MPKDKRKKNNTKIEIDYAMMVRTQKTTSHTDLPFS